MHALMLASCTPASAARRGPDEGDAAYWKAAEACALDKARDLRAREGIGRFTWMQSFPLSEVPAGPGRELQGADARSACGPLHHAAHGPGTPRGRSSR